MTLANNESDGFVTYSSVPSPEKPDGVSNNLQVSFHNNIAGVLPKLLVDRAKIIHVRIDHGDRHVRCAF